MGIAPNLPFPKFKTYWDFAVLLAFKQILKYLGHLLLKEVSLQVIGTLQIFLYGTATTLLEFVRFGLFFIQLKQVKTLCWENKSLHLYKT